VKEGNRSTGQAAKQGWPAPLLDLNPSHALTRIFWRWQTSQIRLVHAKSARTHPIMPSFSSTSRHDLSSIPSTSISTSSPSHSLPARRVCTALSSTSAKTMSSEEANLASPQVPVPAPVPVPVPVLPAPEHHHPHLDPIPFDQHRDSLKRPRSESSDDDGSPEPQGYPAPPGARYGKDSLICDQCGVAFRKHSDLK
jgi:hypothetical protein